MEQELASKVTNKWYQKSIWVIVLLIFFFPVGLFLMWKYTNWNKKAKIVITGLFALILLGSSSSSTTQRGNTQQALPIPTTQETKNTSLPTEEAKPISTTKEVKPTPTTTPVPLDINGFPLGAKHVTVANLDKAPSQYENQEIIFTCKVIGFAKDSKGNATAVNCVDPNDYGSVVQVDIFLFDVTKINQGDTIRFFGRGGGSATGKNAFGGDVTEALVTAVGINDLTSGYKEWL